MKTRETKKQKKPVVVLSEATDGVNKVRLIGSARAEEEEACPWEEIDDYSGRFVMAGYRYDDGSTGDATNDFHPWLAYSTDGGKTWTKSKTTAEEDQTHGQLLALTYGGGRFVVAGHRSDNTGDNYHPWLAYSTDRGKTWTRSETTAEEDQAYGVLRALAYGGGRFVVAGYRYDDTDRYHPWLAYSADGGRTWTKSETTEDEDQAHGQLHALAYGGGRFVVAGFRYDDDDDSKSENYHPWLAYSTDGGKTWTKSETTAKEEQTHGDLRALAYGDGRFVVAGYRYDDDNNSENENYHPWLAYSTDGGETWTKSETTAKEEQTHGTLRALAYGDGRFVVAGFRYDSTDRYHPWLAYSTDGGETWTKSETTAKEEQPHGWLRALAYGGGRFVVAGFRYDIENNENENHHPWLAYSADGGKTWIRSETTADPNQEHGELRALTYAPDSYCWKFGKEEETEETTE